MYGIYAKIMIQWCYMGQGKIKEKEKCFMEKKIKRVVSWVLAVAMVITSMNLNFGVVKAKADEKVVTLYFKLPAGDTATDWGFDVWDGATATNPEGKTVDVSAIWGAGKIYPALSEAEDGWGKIKVTGNIKGCQFLALKDGAVKIYNCWNSAIATKNLTEAYFLPDVQKWYTESAAENEIKAPTLDEIYYVVGDMNSWNISALSDDYKMVEGTEGVYSVTLTGLSKGRHQYKILQDPEDFGWDCAYVSDKVLEGGNAYFDIANTTDKVTISIDTTGESKVVTTVVIAGETPEYTYKEGDVRLYMKLPEGDTAADWGFNVWPASVELRDSGDGTFTPAKWGNSVTTLKAATDKEGFAYVIINGSVEGCQFVNEEGKVYSCWNSNIAKQNLKEAYFDAENNTWYKEDTFENEIKYPVLDDLFYVVGSAPFTWNLSAVATEKFQLKETAKDSKVFEYTNKGTDTVLTPGQLEFKVLQDPDEFAWQYSYKTPGTEGDNSVETVRRADDIITLKLDATGEEKVLTADISSKYNVMVEDGTIADNEVYSGTTANIKANDAAAGKTFDKWVSEDVEVADATASETTFIMPKKDVSVKATYKDLEYTVTFKDGENVLKSEKVKYGESATAPAVEAKEGYALSWDKAFDNITADTVITAVWSAKQYKVTFKDGDKVVKEENVEYGKNATAPTDLKKEGFVLTWDKSYINIKADTVINAVWKEKKADQFEVKFVSDGQVIDTQVVDKGAGAVAPARLLKEGYTLSWDKAFDNVTEDITVTAVWTVNKYTVTFKDGEKVVKTEEVEYGNGATAPTDLAKEGYTLSWDKAFDSIKENTEVNAVWTANKYTVTFKDGDKVVKTEEVEYGKGATAPADLTKEGYTLSWDKAFDSIKENTEINAVWTVRTFTVKYDVNGGSKLKKNSVAVNYGSKLGKLPITKKKGYTLAGWYTKKKGGSKVSTATIIKSARTVYAQWTKVTVSKAKIAKKSTVKGSITVNIKKISKVAGYEYVISLVKKFKGAKKLTTTNNSAKFTKLKKGKTYYVKARAFKKDSTGAKVYGSYSSTAKIVVK